MIMKKRILVLLMALCITTSFMPTFAFATEEEAATSAPTQTEAVQAEESVEPDAAQEVETKAEETKKADEQPVKEEADKAEADESKDMAEPAEAVTEEPQQEEVVEEKPDFEFTPEQADYLSYDPLYLAKYLNKDYVNADEVDMSRFVNVVTAARGVAAYTVDKDKSLDANTFIAGMNYEMPVYNIDDSSKYYVTIPNVNRFNGKNFPAFGLTVGYNNDEAELITGWKYEKGILYIPKTAIDNPKNKHEVPEGAIIAVQMNYAIGKDGDFGKTIPVQVLNGKEPKDKKTYAENIFDLNTLIVDTGVKNRKSSDITVFLNGQMIPIYSDAWEYDSSSGKIAISAMPGVVSNVNIVFKSQTVAEKAKTLATSAVSAVAGEAYAASLNSMDVLKNSAGQEVKLRFDVSQMFVGWRGTYSTDVIYNPKSEPSEWNSVKGYKNSVDYLYGAKTSYSGSEHADASAAVKNKVLARLWAIQSYAVAADTRLGSAGDQGSLTWDEAVTHVYVDSDTTGTMTIYEWLNLYRNTLEKSNKVYGGNSGNGIGGSNNFAAKWPVNLTVAGSATPLAHPEGAPKANPSFVFATDQIGAGTADEYYAASCSELGKAPESDGRKIYVTCLGLDTTSANPYIVLAMVQTNKGQNMTAIYKFGIDVGYVQLTKTQKQTETDFLTEAPNNYSLAGAQYELYKDAACTVRATDISGNPITLTTNAEGKTDIVAVQTGDYYAKEVVASKGFKIDSSVNSGEPVTVTVANTKSNPAQIQSVEEPTPGMPISLRKVNRKGDYGWRRLLGAEYTLSYYDVSPLMTDVSGQTPKRSWVFKTIEKTDPRTGDSYAGIDFATDPKVSGDNFYTVKGDYAGGTDGHANYKHVDLNPASDSIRVMPCGIYTIEETKAPTGLSRNTTVYYGTVTQPQNGVVAKTSANTNMDSTMTIEIGSENDVVNDEDLQSVKIIINKYDKETDQQTAQGATRAFVKGSLAGAKYEVYYDDNDLGAPELVGVITTDADGNGTLTKRELGDERFIGQDLKLGSYLIKEVQASPGYVLDKFYLNGEETEEVPNGEIEVICDYERDGTPVTKTLKGTYEDGQHLFRARAEVIDANLFTHTIKSEETPHHTYVSKTVITTGKELPGALLQVLDSEGNIVEEWTSTDKPHDIVALHDETQGLKDGKYTLREITAPYGYDVAEDVEFEVKSNAITNKVEMKNKPIKIGTTATDAETETHQGVFKEEAQIKDVVKISGLYAGRTYRTKGRIINKATKEPLKDANGNDIYGTLTEVKGGSLKADGDNEFTADGDAVEATLMFTVDTSKFDKDTTTVVFERLERTSKVHEVEADVVPVELQKHEDPDDEAQTIHYGGIVGTTAVDKESLSQNILAGKDVIIVDNIEYKNLSPEETYTLDGELYDKTTGQLTGIKVSVPFTPKTASGTTQVEFKLDASLLAGHDLVAYETLSLKGKIIDEHKDPNDPKQTVHVPKIGTKAGKVKNKKVKDTVSYENLIVGQSYIMKGWLVDKKSGKKVKGSEGEVRFVPTTPNGTVEVTLSVRKAKGNCVAFEECYIVTSVDGKSKETKVGEHKDLNDKDQFVKYTPKSGSPSTGDNNIILIGMAAILAAALATILLNIRRRKAGDIE